MGPRLIALIGPFQSGKTTLLESILVRTGAISTLRTGATFQGTRLEASAPDEPGTQDTFDADLAVVGVVPGSKALTITGLGPDEQPTAPMLYTVGGGTHGVDMGPQITAGPNLTYSTVPP